MREFFLRRAAAPKKERTVARRKSPILTEVELEFMQIIWEAGEVTSDDIQTLLRRRGRDLAGGSVRKVVSILEAKGYVARRPQGRAFLYRAKVPQDSANNRMVLHLLKQAFGGSARLMVAALLDSRAVSTGEMKKIKALIAQHEKEDLQ
jgi:BlaI family transcriptional regulator, penicillinase repressor